MISLLLILSVCFNGLLIWFLYKIGKTHTDLLFLVSEARFKIMLFSDHVKKIYELEMFYGEPVLQNLFEHSRVLLDSLDDFEEDLIMFNIEEEYEQLQAEAEDQDGSSQAREEKEE